MTTSPSAVIVGAGLGGWTTARELRSAGFAGAITLIGDEPYLPYDHPPLSKGFLAGAVDEARLVLAESDRLASLGIRHLRGTTVTSVETGRVTLESGDRLGADHVVVATGARAARPMLLDGFDDVLTLRSRDDALSLRSALSSATSVLVLGGGFVGAEVASTAVSLGLQATIVEAQPELFAATLGHDAGRRVRELHEANGVTVLVGARVERLRRDDASVAAVLADGTPLSADVIVAGFGATLNTQPFSDSDLDVAAGIECDERGRVTGLAGVFAVGDVSRWMDPVVGTPVRREHWSSATDQAGIVAHTICGLEIPPRLATPPYFWSDQHGTKIQLLGRPQLADRSDWIEDEDTASRSVRGYYDGGYLVAVATFGAPRLLGRYRQEIAAGQSAVSRMGLKA